MTAFGSWPADGRPPGFVRSPLGDDAAAFYEENGYLVVEDAFSPHELDALKGETVRICRGGLGEVAGLVPSGPDESDEDVLKKTLCIHFPNKISPLMKKEMSHPSLVEVLRTVIGPDASACSRCSSSKRPASLGRPGTRTKTTFRRGTAR